MDPKLIEIDDDDDEDPVSSITKADAIRLCKQVEKLVVTYGDSASSLELPCLLRKFRRQLRHTETMNTKQDTLDNYFTRSAA